jgi:hypothetical protein
VENSKVIRQREAVDARLAELGLSAALLTTAVEEGQAEAARCTLNDAPMAQGFLAWDRTLRALRERLIPRGWVRDNGDLPTVKDPASGVAIAVASGDEFVGDPEVNPTTRNPRGPSTIKAVQSNGQQTFLPPGSVDRDKVEAAANYWLLFNANPAEGLLQIELSKPSLIDGSGYVTAWFERIILPPTPLPSTPVLVDASQLPAAPDFDVRPKAL